MAKQNNIKFIPHADYVITENGDTINNYNLNAYPKALFADEKGNAIFVARPHEHLKEINQRLKETPMYPIMVDNGRFYDYQLSNPNVNSYSGLENAANMFILGTVKSSGGPIVNMFDDGGKTYIGGADQELVVTPEQTFMQSIADRDPYVDYQFYSPTGNGIVQTINSTPRWQQYWADQEGSRVSNAMHQASPKVLDLLTAADGVAGGVDLLEGVYNLGKLANNAITASKWTPM